MRKMSSVGFFLLAISALSSGLPLNAAADDVTFKIKSMAQYDVLVKFFSSDRRVHWPSGDRAYDLKDYADHAIKLSCIKDEKICYGAWLNGNKGTYWGVGPEGNGVCSGCCYSCSNGTTREIVLRDPVRR